MSLAFLLTSCSQHSPELYHPSAGLLPLSFKGGLQSASMVILQSGAELDHLTGSQGRLKSQQHRIWRTCSCHFLGSSPSTPATLEHYKHCRNDPRYQTWAGKVFSGKSTSKAYEKHIKSTSKAHQKYIKSISICTVSVSLRG